VTSQFIVIYSVSQDYPTPLHPTPPHPTPPLCFSADQLIMCYLQSVFTLGHLTLDLKMCIFGYIVRTLSVFLGWVLYFGVLDQQNSYQFFAFPPKKIPTDAYTVRMAFYLPCHIYLHIVWFKVKEHKT
jgi:hypothetical protein